MFNPKIFSKTLPLFYLSLVLVSCTAQSSSNPELINIHTERGSGCMNDRGEVLFVVPPKALSIDCVSKGNLYVYSVSDFEKGYVNNKGEIVTNPEFVSAKGLSDGLAVVAKPTTPNLTGAKLMQAKRKYGFVDSTGKIAISPQFDFADSFSEGVALVAISDKYGFINKEGKIVINPQFDFAKNFSEDLASIMIDQKIGFINKEGKITINPQFETDDLFLSDFSFSEGLAAVKLGGKWGFIDKQGKFIINPQFKNALSFSEGLAAVDVDGKWGFIDKQGKFIVNPQFNRVRRFSEGLAAVMVGEMWGFVDKQGKFVVNPQAKYLSDGHRGKIKSFVLEDGKGQQTTIYMNLKGEYITKRDSRGNVVN